MFETQVFLEFLVLGRRDSGFAAALDQLSNAGLRLLGGAKVGDALGRASGGEKVKDFIECL